MYEYLKLYNYVQINEYYYQMGIFVGNYVIKYRLLGLDRNT